MYSQCCCSTTLPPPRFILLLCRDGRVFVRKLKHVQVESLQGALELMKEGSRNKAVSAVLEGEGGWKKQWN